MKKHEITIIIDAREDIEQLYEYISEHDSFMNAENLIIKLEEACYSLNLLPERGHRLPEFENIDFCGYREIHYKPYRIIYEIINDEVLIHTVLDGRRSLDDLLKKRLLDG